MNTIPQGSPDYKKRNPHLFPALPSFVAEGTFSPKPTQKVQRVPKPLLNKTEQRYFDLLTEKGWWPMKQAITLRLDPPFRSYTPDLAYVSVVHGLIFVEVKGLHRFREKGIAKAALAAKTYPFFRFELAQWDGKEWKVSVLSK